MKKIYRRCTNAMHRVGPVSYTHLDVYKRQGYKLTPWSDNGDSSKQFHGTRAIFFDLEKAFDKTWKYNNMQHMIGGSEVSRLNLAPPFSQTRQVFPCSGRTITIGRTRAGKWSTTLSVERRATYCNHQRDLRGSRNISWKVPVSWLSRAVLLGYSKDDN